MLSAAELAAIGGSVKALKGANTPAGRKRHARGDVPDQMSILDQPND